MDKLTITELLTECERRLFVGNHEPLDNHDLISAVVILCSVLGRRAVMENKHSSKLSPVPLILDVVTKVLNRETPYTLKND